MLAQHKPWPQPLTSCLSVRSYLSVASLQLTSRSSYQNKKLCLQNVIINCVLCFIVNFCIHCLYSSLDDFHLIIILCSFYTSFHVACASVIELPTFLLTYSWCRRHYVFLIVRLSMRVSGHVRACQTGLPWNSSRSLFLSLKLLYNNTGWHYWLLLVKKMRRISQGSVAAQQIVRRCFANKLP